MTPHNLLEKETVSVKTSLKEHKIFLYIIAFIAGSLIMVLELIAGRIIAPYVGVSLYTWTSVIGIVLAGISLGNYLGGLIADQKASIQLLSRLFIFTGISCLAVLPLTYFLPQITEKLDLITQILILTIALFFIPCTLLGSISPIVMKLCITNLDQAGSTIGRISALSTIGSIITTFLTGFFLISWFGVNQILFGIASILLFLGLLLSFFFQKLENKSSENKKSFFFTILSNICCLLLCGFIFQIFVSSNLINGVCKYESNYFCIRVLTAPLSELCKTGSRLLKTNNICGLDKNKDSNEKISILFLDNLIHSFNSQINPSLLVYEYERVYAKVFDYAQKNKLALNTIFIGGGGYTFPRYVESIDTKSSIEVIEIDPLVTQTAYKELGLSAKSRIVSHNEDARTFFSKQIKASKANKLDFKKYDLIFGDAFRDISIPYHLVTKEFNDMVKTSLEPDGLYVANVIDGKARNYQFLRSYLKTIKRSFAYVYILPARENWKQASRITFVVIASDKPLNETSWSKSIDKLPGQNMIINSKYLNQTEIKELLSLDNKSVLLTDMYSPVEQMMAPTIAAGNS